MQAPLKSYSFVVADEQSGYRKGFSSLLSEHVQVKNTYYASDGFELIKILNHHVVDIVFLDYMITFINGEECMRIIKRDFPKIKVIIISMMDSTADILKMMHAGVHGFIIKNFNGNELVVAINTVMAGRKYFDSYISTMLIEQKLNTNSNYLSLCPVLTFREKQILRLITYGKLSKEIADSIHITQHTVDKHRKSILKKINGRGIADAIRYSLLNGVVHMNEFLYNMNEKENHPQLRLMEDHFSRRKVSNQ